MKQLVDQSVQDPVLIEFVRRNPMNEKQILDYVYKKAIFQPDKAGKQVIKTPRATLRTNTANCVDYSVLIATLLKLNNINGVLRMVRFKKGSFPKHIYVVTEDGIVLDASIGQVQEGERSFEERTKKLPEYDTEVKYYNKFDTAF